MFKEWEIIKRPLKKAIVDYALSYKKLFPDKVKKPNTQFILELEKDFFTHYCNKGEEPLYRALFHIWATENENDDSHEKYFNYILMKVHEGILSRKYKLYPPNKYTVCWR